MEQGFISLAGSSRLAPGWLAAWCCWLALWLAPPGSLACSPGSSCLLPWACTWQSWMYILTWFMLNHVEIMLKSCWNHVEIMLTNNTFALVSFGKAAKMYFCHLWHLWHPRAPKAYTCIHIHVVGPVSSQKMSTMGRFRISVTKPETLNPKP